MPCPRLEDGGVGGFFGLFLNIFDTQEARRLEMNFDMQSLLLSQHQSLLSSHYQILLLSSPLVHAVR